MPQTMTAKAVRENELTPLAKEIRRMADLVNTEKREFTAEERAAWEKVNKDYDACRARVDVLERSDKIDDYMKSPLEGAPPGRDDFNGKTKSKRAAGDDGAQALTPEIHALAMQGWMRSQLGKPLKKRHETAIATFNRSQKRSRFQIHPQSRDMHISLERDFGRVRRDHRVGALERRNLSALSETAGAYTIAEGFMSNLEEAQLAYASVYDVADVMRTSGGNEIPWPTVNDTSNKGALLSENTSIGNSVDPPFSQVVFRAYKITSKLVLVPAELLEDSAFNLGNWLGMALGTRIGRIKADLFTFGSGAASPTGYITDATLGVTAASASVIAADEIYKLKHSVDPAYRSGASFSMHDNTLLNIKLLKDGMGRYLWQAGLAGGAPDRLDGDPIFINQSMDQIATTKKTLAYGQMKKFKIRDVASVRLRRLVERYADADQEGFIMFVRSDSKLLDAGTHPIKYLQQA
jgi:HK97 family phage major capsid protein